MPVQDSSTPWYVVHTRPQKEVFVSGLLEQKLRVQVYLPEVSQKRRGRLQRAPFFPGYLFVQVDLQHIEASTINTLPGVIRIVSFGDRPQPLPAWVVDSLRQKVDALNAQGGLPPHPFHPGDTVRLKTGPLEGLDAVFVGPMRPSQRVRVLLTFLGQLQEAEVDVEDLEKASAAPAAHSRAGRRTRGKGRRIHPKPEAEAAVFQ